MESSKENRMLLRQLSNLDGAAGAEHAVRDFIRAHAERYVDTADVDALGNLICLKKGKKKRPVIMLVAHMDEVGLMITAKNKDGTLRFSRIGGINEQVLLAQAVRIGEKKIPGVIGVKPIHILDETEAKKMPKVEELYIDMGATSEGELKDIAIGDYAYFDTEYEKISASAVMGKAFDDRLGCALMLEMAQKEFNFPIYFVFTTQEEIGLRGAQVIGNRINPDYAIILEGTGAGDSPSERDIALTPILGNGPTLTVKDRSMIADPVFLKRIIALAKRKHIPYQIKQPGIGGTDAGRIQISQRGVRCAVIAVPARYIHSPASLMSLKDYQNARRLALVLLKDLGRTEGK
jgi:putative aminopeptidase FrvX